MILVIFRGSHAARAGSGLPEQRCTIPGMYYALFYNYVPDVLDRRGPYRPDHLSLAGEYQRRGELLLAGAWANPTDGALLVFRTDGPEPVERFVSRDPYVANGLVTSHRIREWTVVVPTQPGT